MKKTGIFLIILIIVLQPMTALAGTLIGPSMEVKKTQSTSPGNNYPSTASFLTRTSTLSDNSFSTCDPGLLVDSGAYFGSFYTKKVIDSYYFRSTTSWTGDLYFYDQNFNLVSSVENTAQMSSSGSTPIMLSSPVTAYYWKFVNDETSGRSVCELRFFEVNDTFPPTVPNITSATGGNLSVTLNWTKPSDIDLNGYKIYQGGNLIHTVTNTNITTYTVTGLTPNQSYAFQVSAYDDSNNESNKSAITYGTATDTTPPTAPTGLVANPMDNEVSLSWNPSTDNHTVQGYHVYVNNNYHSSTTATTASVGGLFNTLSYNFKIVAYDPTGNVSAPGTISATPIDIYPPYQKPVIVTNKTETSITVQWEYSDSVDIEFYHVTKNNFNGYTTITHTGNTTYNFTYNGLNSGQTYTIKVRAQDDDGLTSTAQSVTETTMIQPPSTPSGLTVTPLDNQNNLDWTSNTETDLAGYKVYYVGQTTPIVTVTSSDYNNLGLLNAVEKCYQVTAFDVHGNESPKSGGVCGTPIDIYPPFDVSNIQTVSFTEYSYTFKWDKSTSPDIDLYKIYKNNSPLTTVQDDGSLSYQYTANDLMPGTVYNFQVNPVDDDGNELTTGTQGLISLSTISVPPNAPTGLSAVPSIGSIAFTWNASTEPDVTSYNLYKQVNGSYSLVTTINHPTTNYTLSTNDSANTNYVLSAVDQGGGESVFSSPVVTAATPVGPPPQAFENVNSPIQAGDIVSSGFSLLGSLKWFIILGLAGWFVIKMIELIRKSNDPNAPTPQTSEDGKKIVTKKTKAERQAEQEQNRKIREERKRTQKIESEMRKKMSRSVGYKIYKP